MTFVPHLREELATATSLLDLGQRLGKVCLGNAKDLSRLMSDRTIANIVHNLEQTVGAAPDAAFEEIDDGAGFLHLLDLDDVEDRLALVETHSPLEYLAFLRGLCRRALPREFLAMEGIVTLDRGMPFELVSRRVNDQFDDHTPALETLSRGSLLRGLRFTLYQGSATDDPIDVRLDYSVRERLDGLAWTDAARLPRVATVHPTLERDGIAVSTSTESGSFFDVRPKRWDQDEVLAELERVASDAEIAVLPELCMPADAVAAFGQALASAPERYPPLVVAGSAHVRRADPQTGEEIRVNECRVYLDGERVMVHDKVHPFATKMLGTTADGKALEEGFTLGPKTLTLLSGEHTRLGVVICSDLVDHDVPRLLEQAGVNLLLVPSLTFDAGTFNGAVCNLASFCQAFSAIVNADVDSYLDEQSEAPFRVMASIPRSDPAEQSRSFPDSSEPRRSLGLLDVNDGLAGAMRWLERDDARPGR